MGNYPIPTSPFSPFDAQWFKNLFEYKPHHPLSLPWPFGVGLIQFREVEWTGDPS